MAIGTRQENTMTEGLRSIMGTLSEMKVEPDADLQFILHLEQEIVTFLRSPNAGVNAAGLSQVPAGPGPGGPPGLAGPQGPPPGAIPQQGVPGLPQAPGPLPPELARALAQGPTAA